MNSKKRMLLGGLSLAILLIVGCQHAALSTSSLAADTHYGRWSGEFPSSGPMPSIIMAQWHLAPGIVTKDKSTHLPQTENQLAIYRQLEEWVDKGLIHSVITEGCEGEIKEGFKPRFNGWTLEDLQARVKNGDDLEPIMTQVGLKLKAKYGDKLQVVCGDNLKLIKQHQLALSELRGLFGFKVRIQQFANDLEKQNDYLKTLKSVLHLPDHTSTKATMVALHEALQKNLKLFMDLLHERDAVFVRVAEKMHAPFAVVIGALHVHDLSQQMTQDGIHNAVFIPNGLQGDEGQLIEEIQREL